jgi:hypothetical protein
VGSLICFGAVAGGMMEDVEEVDVLALGAVTLSKIGEGLGDTETLFSSSFSSSPSPSKSPIYPLGRSAGSCMLTSEILSS